MRTLLGLSALCVLACGDAREADPDPVVVSGGQGGSDAGRSSQGGLSGSSSTDGGGAFVRTLIVDGDAATDTMGSPDEVDVFAFEGQGGSWVSVSTWPGDGAFGGDTIVSVVDETGTLLGESDVAPRIIDDDRDARLILRLPEDGRYEVRVRDAGLPPEFFDSTAATPGGFYVYRVSVESLVSGAGVAIAEPDPETGVSFVTHRTDGLEFGHALLLGALDSVTDARTFSFEVPAGEDRAFVAELVPTRLVTSDEPVQSLSVRQSAGEVIATVTPPDGRVMLSPSLGTGSFSVFVEGAAQQAGEFVVLAELSPENPLEQAEALNGSVEGAELLDFDEATRRAYLLSHLPEGDVDYYRFDAPAASGVEVHCSSYQSGSGVVDLEVDIIDETGTTIASMIEPPSGLLALEDVALGSAGPYFVKLSKLAQEEGVSGDWARCVVFLE